MMNIKRTEGRAVTVKEVFKPVKNEYRELYEVSNLGRVRSRKTKRVMAPYKNTNGYIAIKLCANGKRKTYHVHRLVMEAFTKVPEGLQVNHIDEDKTNNRLDNLEWVTPAENINHGTRNQRVAEANSKKVECITTGRVFASATEASATYGVHKTNIFDCCRGERKSAGKLNGIKLRWKYV